MGVTELLVLADDATGALDTGVQFARNGISTFVALRTDAEPPKGARVLVVDTDSRHDAPEIAARKVRLLAARYAAMGVSRFYKKTDSVLRGNVGSELAALREAVGGTLCFVPFYPAQGRSTRGGMQYVSGVRVDESTFARDPANPVTCADIRRLLSRGGLSVEVTAPPYNLPGRPPDALIFDGDSEYDLSLAARAIYARGLGGLTAGCAGFAAHIDVGEGGNMPSDPIEHPVLIASGSVAAATLAQIRAARDAGVFVAVPSLGQWLGRDDIAPMLATLKAELRAGRSAVLASAMEDDSLLEPGLLEPGCLQALMALWVGKLAETGAARAVMAIGGDFLSALLGRLSIGGLWPVRELAPGVALCRAGDLMLITKSGGFGPPELLAGIAKGDIR